MEYLTQNRAISVGTRLGTMLLDHCLMTAIMMFFIFPGLLSSMTDGNSAQTTGQPGGMGDSLLYTTMFGFTLYFCKDIFNGRSIAKRILKLQLVDNASGNVASPVQCMVRNLFCVIWPLEVLVAMNNTGRRLGDRVAGTLLIPYDPELEQPPVEPLKIILAVAISFGVIFGLMQLLPLMTR